MIVQFDLHQAQLDIVNNRRKYNHVRMGRRFGKSVLAYTLLAEAAVGLQVPAAYVTPTAEDYGRRWRECVEFLKPLIQDVYVSSGEIRLKQGKSIYFHGMHRFDGMRGNHYGRVIIDEAAHSPNLEEAWTYVISATLADLDGDAYFHSTPKGGNYFKSLEEQFSGNPDWAFFHKPSSANPYLKPDVIQKQKEMLPSAVFRQEWLAEYVDFVGARIKREWIKDRPIHRTPDHENYTYVLGVDPAVSEDDGADYTACVVMAIPNDKTKPRIVVDAQRTRISQLESVANYISAIAKKWDVVKLACEQVTFSVYLVQALRRNLPLVQHIPTKPTKDKLTRFLPLEGQVEHGHVKFADSLSKDYIDELLSFTGDGKGHDDLVDATVHAELAGTKSSAGIFLT